MKELLSLPLAAIMILPVILVLSSLGGKVLQEGKVGVWHYFSGALSTLANA